MAGYYDRQGAGVNDFDEYDADPYNGGYDQAIAYGRPIPPSEDTCYLPSTPGHDEDEVNYGSESSPYEESRIDQGRHTYGSGSVQSHERPKPKPKPAYDYEEDRPSYGSGSAQFYERPNPKPKPAYDYEEDIPSYGSGSAQIYERPNPKPKPAYDYEEDRPSYGSESVPCYERPRPKPKPAYNFEPNAYGGEEYSENPMPASSWNRPTLPPQEYHQSGYGDEWKKPSYGEELQNPSYGYGEEEPEPPKFGRTEYAAEEEYSENPRPASSWNRPIPPPQEYHQPDEWRKPSSGYGEEEPKLPKFGSSGYGVEEEYGRPQRPSYYQQQQEEEAPKFERPTYSQPEDEGYERPHYGGDHEKKHGRHHHQHHSYDDE